MFKYPVLFYSNSLNAAQRLTQTDIANVARKFLYLIAAIITLVIAGGFVVRKGPHLSWYNGRPDPTLTG